MALHHLTCPHCGAGFDSHGAGSGHGSDAHRDSTPRDRDQLTCPSCREQFEARPERDAIEAEKLRKAQDRIE